MTLVVTGSVQNAAGFDVAGQASTTYAITLPADGTITIGHGVPADDMAVNTFTSNPNATGTLSGAGAQSITVGATLTVAAGQVPASYTGTFPVSVDYN